MIKMYINIIVVNNIKIYYQIPNKIIEILTIFNYVKF